MRVRNHALDGLRGLAALGVLTLHVWMFTVQGAHGREELVSLLTGEPRLGVVLFFVLSGYLLAGPWVASALEGRPTPRLGRFAVKRAARIVPAYWVAMLGSFYLLSGSGHDYEVSAGQLPLFAAFGQNYVASAAGRLDPPMWSLVVEVSFYAVLPLAGWVLVRCARRGRMVAACAGLMGLGLAWSAAGALLAWPETAMSTVPTFLPVFACGMAAAALAHRRVPAHGLARALMVSGAVVVCADAWWHRGGGGGGRRSSAGGALARAAARPGHHLLRPVPVAPARAAVVALRGPDARRLRGPVARGDGARRAGRVRELGARRAAGDRGRRPLAPVDAPRPELPGRAARQAGAERGVSRATTVSGS
jgi:peptidoglycan/LPS O-acetylase OafA/YrhL